jgi:hypothetical protein
MKTSSEPSAGNLPGPVPDLSQTVRLCVDAGFEVLTTVGYNAVSTDVSEKIISPHLHGRRISLARNQRENR